MPSDTETCAEDDESCDPCDFDLEDTIPIMRSQDAPNPPEPPLDSNLRPFKTAIGLTLAFISGLIFTGNNCVIQTFSLDFAETLLLRSFIQSSLVGTALLAKGITVWPQFEERPHFHRFVMMFQGLLGGFMIICSFCSVLYLPLGDALTLIFSAPISTMVMAAIFLGHRLRFYKITFGLLLLSGTVLVVRPPFLFNVNWPAESFDPF